jgi:hypothetical protein
MSPRKIVRRDQSICPIDKSKTRIAADRNGGAWRAGPAAHGACPGDAGTVGSGAVSLI